MFKKISILGFMVLLSGSIFLTSCDKDKDNDNSNSNTPENKGYVFTMSNSDTGNELIQYMIQEDGGLKLKTILKTGGTGSGGGLGSQGAVTISADKKFVFAVNAKDNSVSSFTISSDGTLSLVGKYNLVGIRPISIAQKGGLVYILNSAGTTGSSSIEGFTLNATTGALTAIPNSYTIFEDNINPAQISFVYNNVVVITERATNILASYTLNASNVPTNRQTATSQASQPYGFAVGKNGRIFVTEASSMSSVSSYSVSTTGTISNISTLPNNQGGACWAVLNDTESIVYSTNGGSNTISSFNINASGNLTSTQIAFDLGTGNGPLDAGINRSNQYLYVLAGTGDKIFGYNLKANTLTQISGATMFVPGATFGLAVY